MFCCDPDLDVKLSTLIFKMTKNEKRYFESGMILILTPRVVSCSHD